jgi:hypothetical protein
MTLMKPQHDLNVVEAGSDPIDIRYHRYPGFKALEAIGASSVFGYA